MDIYTAIEEFVEGTVVERQDNTVKAASIVIQPDDEYTTSVIAEGLRKIASRQEEQTPFLSLDDINPGSP